jgi:hypothetical protein
MGRAKREYKDNIFRRLFSSKEKILELYSAVTGNCYNNKTKVKINTLENMIFNDKMNDISFVIDDKIVVLIEHQSTINENLPLRFLLYIARIYEKYIENINIFNTKLEKIPVPKFIALYNGKENYPEKKILRLSRAFKIIEKGIELDLDIKVTVLNINKGYNKDILGNSKSLKDYAEFSARARENLKKGMTLDKALRETISYCSKHAILGEFLKSYDTEVIIMLSKNITWEEIAEIRKEEGRKEGYAEILQLLKQGYTPEDIEKKLNLKSK